MRLNLRRGRQGPLDIHAMHAAAMKFMATFWIAMSHLESEILQTCVYKSAAVMYS
jgi:hypothetical protein